MAGRVLPAICGPAGQGRGQDAADGAVVAVDVAIVVEGDGLAGGDLVALAGDPAVQPRELDQNRCGTGRRGCPVPSSACHEMLVLHAYLPLGRGT